VHVHARAVKTFCRWLLAEGLVPADPFARVSMPRLEKRILPALTSEDLGHLLAVASDRERAVVLCLLDSGLRASEFVGLNVGDVDTRSGSVIVRQGKGRKDRVTFLGAKSRRALLRWLRCKGDRADSSALWTSENTGDRLTASGLLLLCRRLGYRAGVAHCSPHVFRRTFALFSLRAGADLHSLAAMMGHAGVEVLSHYLDLQQDDLHEVHRRCSPGDRLTT
jgi:integrase/recombinase XerD